MITIWIVLGMLALVVVMEVFEYRARKRTRLGKTNKKLRDEKGRFKRLRDSETYHKDNSRETAQKMEKEISDLEDAEKYFSDL